MNQHWKIFLKTWSFKPITIITGTVKIDDLQAEMAEAVKAKRKSRGGHRTYVNQVLPEAKELAAGQCTGETRPQIAQLKASLEEQLTCLRQLDKEILRDLVDVEGVTDEDITEEAQVTGNLKGDINATIAALAELLRQKTAKSSTGTSP